MSLIEHKEKTSSLNRIPIGRRIEELMTEKGSAFSIRAFSARLGMSKDILRRMLIGERRIAPSELERMANGLGVSIQRLKQADTQSTEQDLISLLSSNKRTKVLMTRAYNLANELIEVARGATERGFSLYYLGHVQYLQQQYDEAHQIFLRALDFAKKVQNQYSDNSLLLQVTTYLMITYTIRKEYSDMEEMLSLVEQVFPDNPNALGKAYYARMKMLEERGDLEGARTQAYRSLKYFEQLNLENQIGRSLINVAHYEFILGNYKASEQALSSAMNIAKHFEDILILAVKEYVKTLMKLRDHGTAIRVIEEYLPLATEYTNYYGKLMIMNTVAKGDPSFAVTISDDTTASKEVRYFACKCLMEFYALKGDAPSVLSYYEKGRIFSNKKSEFLDEEGF